MVSDYSFCYEISRHLHSSLFIDFLLKSRYKKFSKLRLFNVKNKISKRLVSENTLSVYLLSFLFDLQTFYKKQFTLCSEKNFITKQYVNYDVYHLNTIVYFISSQYINLPVQFLFNICDYNRLHTFYCVLCLMCV